MKKEVRWPANGAFWVDIFGWTGLPWNKESLIACDISIANTSKLLILKLQKKVCLYTQNISTNTSNIKIYPPDNQSDRLWAPSGEERPTGCHILAPRTWQQFAEHFLDQRWCQPWNFMETHFSTTSNLMASAASTFSSHFSTSLSLSLFHLSQSWTLRSQCKVHCVVFPALLAQYNSYLGLVLVDRVVGDYLTSNICCQWWPPEPFDVVESVADDHPLPAQQLDHLRQED